MIRNKGHDDLAENLQANLICQHAYVRQKGCFFQAVCSQIILQRRYDRTDGRTYEQLPDNYSVSWEAFKNNI